MVYIIIMSIVEFSCADLDDASVECIVVDGEPWFKGRDVATILGYSNLKKAIQMHVDDDDKATYSSLVSSVMGTQNGSLRPQRRYHKTYSTQWVSNAQPSL